VKGIARGSASGALFSWCAADVAVPGHPRAVTVASAYLSPFHGAGGLTRATYREVLDALPDVDLLCVDANAPSHAFAPAELLSWTDERGLVAAPTAMTRGQNEPDLALFRPGALALSRHVVVPESASDHGHRGMVFLGTADVAAAAAERSTPLRAVTVQWRKVTEADMAAFRRELDKLLSASGYLRTADSLHRRIVMAIATASAATLPQCRVTRGGLPTPLRRARQLAQQSWARLHDAVAARGGAPPVHLQGALAAASETGQAELEAQLLRAAQLAAEEFSASVTAYVRGAPAALWEARAELIRAEMGRGGLTDGMPTAAEMAAFFAEVAAPKPGSRTAEGAGVPALPPGTALPAVTAHEVDIAIEQARGCPDALGVAPRHMQGMGPAARFAVQRLCDLALQEVAASGRWPSCWACGFLGGLPKPGDAGPWRKKLRPVVVSPALGRVFERVLHARDCHHRYAEADGEGGAGQDAERRDPGQYAYRGATETALCALRTLLATELPQATRLRTQAEVRRYRGANSAAAKGGCEESGIRHLGVVVALDAESAFTAVSGTAMREEAAKMRAGNPLLARLMAAFVGPRTITVRGPRGDTAVAEFVEGGPQGGVITPDTFEGPMAKVGRDVREAFASTPPALSKAEIIFADDMTFAIIGPLPSEVVAAATTVVMTARKSLTELGLAVSPKSSYSWVGHMSDVEVSRADIDGVRHTELSRILGVWVGQGEKAANLEATIAKLRAAGDRALRMFAYGPVALRETLLADAAGAVWGAPYWAALLTPTDWGRVEAAWASAARVVAGVGTSTRTDSVLEEMELPSLRELIDQRLCTVLEEVEATFGPDHPALRHELPERVNAKLSPPQPYPASMYPGTDLPPPPRVTYAPLVAPAATRWWSRVLVDVETMDARRVEPEAARLDASERVVAAARAALPGAVEVYTDGSVSEEGRATYAFSVRATPPPGQALGEAVLESTGRSSPGACSFKAEADALSVAAAAIAARGEEWCASRQVLFFSDSKSVLSSLRRGPVSLRRASDRPVAELARRLLALADRGWSVRLAFVGSHCGLAGNERADALAAAPPDPTLPPTPVWLTDRARARAQNAATRRPQRRSLRQDFGCPTPERRLAGLRTLTTSDQRRLLRARVGVMGWTGASQAGVVIPCPLCAAPAALGRSGKALAHLAVCTALAKERSEHGVAGLPVFWEDGKEKAVVAFLAAAEERFPPTVV
jgi:ribonuclease HI